MVSALDYSAVVEHHYDVRVLDGREAVRYDKDRAAFHQLIHAALNKSLGARIYRGGRLVEDHDGRVGDRRSGYGYKLALTLREPRAVTLEHGVVAVGEHTDKAVRVGELRRLYALLIRG